MRGNLRVVLITAAVLAVVLASAAWLDASRPTTETVPNPTASPGGGPSGGTAPTGPASPSNGTSSPGSSTPGAGNSTAPFNETASNLTLTMALAAPTSRVDQTVGFVLTLTNRGTENQTVTVGGCIPWLTVANASGPVYNQSAGICPLWVSVGILGPGESWNLSRSWAEETSSDQTVSPGSYQLTEFWPISADEMLTATAPVDITLH